MNHLYRFRLAVTDATVPTVVVVVCGSHVVVDWNLHLPDAASLGPSLWQTNEKLSAKLVRMGLETGWTRQNIYFVPKSPLVNNFGTNTCQMTEQLREFHSALRVKTKLTNITTEAANLVPWVQLVNTHQLPLWLRHTYSKHNNHRHRQQQQQQQQQWRQWQQAHCCRRHHHHLTLISQIMSSMQPKTQFVLQILIYVILNVTYFCMNKGHLITH